MEIMKDILLVFGGGMPGATVMRSIHASTAADRTIEKKGKW